MKRRFNPDRHHRKSIRLRERDYARPGVYFITICTQDRIRLFGEIVHGRMHLNAAGLVAQSVWAAIPTHFRPVRLDAFVVMPDHVHGVIVIARSGPNASATVNPTAVNPTAVNPTAVNPTAVNPTTVNPTTANPTTAEIAATAEKRATHASPLPLPIPWTRGSVGAIVGSYKSAVARQINQLRGTPGAPIWQRNYYERIIRDSCALQRIREYIEANPRR